MLKKLNEVNLSTKDRKMDVFDQDAVIIFISADDTDGSIGRFITANKMFYAALGYTPEGMEGKKINHCMPKFIEKDHDSYLTKFTNNKVRFTSWIRKTYA